MEIYLVLLILAVLVTSATEPMKNMWDQFVLLKTGAMSWHDITVGIFLPLLFSFPAVFGLGYGILGAFMEFQYATNLLMYTDLIMTACIVSLGANKLFDIVQQIVNKFQ